MHLGHLAALALESTLCKGCNKCWIQLIHMLLYLEELATCSVTRASSLIYEFESSKQERADNILDSLQKRSLDYW